MFFLSLLLLYCAEADVIFTESYTDYSYKDRFEEQYSWVDHNPEGELAHFKVVEFSGKNVLNVSLYYGDKPFEKDSPTLPRTELRETRYKIPNDVDLQVEWDWYLPYVPEGFWFCFMQLFMDTEPNIMLRWELDNYLLYTAAGHAVLSGNIHDDVGKWRTWRVAFNLSSDSRKGYVSVYKSNVHIGTFKGRTAIPGILSSYFKQGIYTQHGDHAQDINTYLSNLVFSTN
eukprot:TRINITY_DN11546_c0_g1_i1.p1 TRINITY_DN11546_c0_g1~~TRINITY_DN11546_c0_g1_i1.p1  ORF type:complete len:229 (+),score=27.72 TRINITY_DN11546_c0_g1_i1:81-767(+)